MKAEGRASEDFKNWQVHIHDLAEGHFSVAGHKCIQDIERRTLTVLEGDARHYKSRGRCSAVRDAYVMEGENGRMATMEGSPFYNIPEIWAKLDVWMCLGLSYKRISREG